jgi:hypothetical protein
MIKKISAVFSAALLGTAMLVAQTSGSAQSSILLRSKNLLDQTYALRFDPGQRNRCFDLRVQTPAPAAL